jgi:hypothetical protein
MTEATGKNYPVGMRHAIIFALNSNGSPAATLTTAYEGVQIVGSKAFNLNIPDPRKFTHVGDDGPIQSDYLPPTEAASAEISASQDNNAVYALATGTTEVTIAESKVVGIGTSKQGSEPQVAALCYQQSLDENGARNYRWYLIPKATLYPKPAGMGENPIDTTYTVNMAVVTKYPWEKAFTANTEGFIRSQVLKGQSVYKPKIVAWLATTGQTEFVLPTSYPAQATGKMALFVDGVEQTENTTAGTTQIQFTTAPGNAKRVVAFYEHE